MNKLLLIDGHSILSRAFFGIPMLTTSEGLHTNAVYGFLTIMFKALDEERADHAAVAFDLDRKLLNRTKLYPEYKGTRKPMPPELHEQVPMIRDMLEKMNIPVVTLEGYEADDILGTLSLRYRSELPVTILSGDRDLLQLADDVVKISIPKTVKGKTELFQYYAADVEAEYGVTPTEFIDMKALMGDTSDNIPGLPGVGEKTAAQIIRTYHSIENAALHADEVRPPRAAAALREHYDLAELSKKLAAIDREAPVELQLSDTEIRQMYTAEALELCRRYEFKSFFDRFQNTDIPKKTGISTEQVKKVTDPYLASVLYRDAEQCDTQGVYYSDSPCLAAAALPDGRSYVILPGVSYPEQQLKADLSAFLTRLTEKKIRIASMDVKRQLKTFGIRRSRYFLDLGIAMYLLDPTKASYDYDDISRDILGITLESRKELDGRSGRQLSLFDTEPDDDELRAAALSAMIPLAAADGVLRRLTERGMRKLYEEIELPLIYTLNDMENAGVRVDRQALDTYAAKLAEEIRAREQEIYQIAGERFNINSPSQLGTILFEKLGIPGGRKTKIGYSTAADVLMKLSGTHPVIDLILRYRTITKLYSTYAAGLTPYIAGDGRIHSTFHQTITATGRLSSADPNLQNIPVRTGEGREIRKVFIPGDGYTFVDADYSQVELRILAALSGDEKLINAYRDSVDIHALTASEVFHVPIGEVTKEMRKDAKAVNFGIVYGISAFGLGEGLSISRQEAAEYIEKYFETYPGVKKYLDAQVAAARKDGYVRTAYGRIRPVPDIHASNFQKRSFSERVAMNSPVQGTAADIMKIAMNRISMRLAGMDTDGRLCGKQYASRIVLQVHDELLLEAAPSELDEVMQLVKEEMEGAADLAVRLLADVQHGSNWDECH